MHSSPCRSSERRSAAWLVPAENDSPVPRDLKGNDQLAARDLLDNSNYRRALGDSLRCCHGAYEGVLAPERSGPGVSIREKPLVVLGALGAKGEWVGGLCAHGALPIQAGGGPGTVPSPDAAAGAHRLSRLQRAERGPHLHRRAPPTRR